MTQHIECLQTCLNGMRAEIASISIVGRALTPEESMRLTALHTAEASILSVMATLGSSVPPQPAPASTLRDGSYFGGDGNRAIELRLDVGGSNMISLDLFQISAGGARTWLTTIRTNPTMPIGSSSGEFGVVAEGQNGSVVRGTLTVNAISDDETASVALVLDEPVTGVAGNTAHNFVAAWQAASMRSLGLEVEREVGINSEPTFQRADGSVVTTTSCLAEAGFTRFDMGQRSDVPAPPAPGKWGTAQLHALMVEHAQSSLASAKSGLHLLRLAESTTNGLLGIMFDSGDTLPRQGSAVFEDEVVNFYPHDPQRKTIQTTVHELGHALNLAHRFERVVGRADSLSFMNYDSRYKGGGHETEFWNQFNFEFDPDELAFLRHGPLSAVIPGGRSFHTVPYWSEGNGGYVPYKPEQELTFLSLRLTGPGDTTGPILFEFLQPVFMRVELTNLSNDTLDLPGHFLDPKSGSLDIVVRRVGALDDTGDIWVPMMQRCQAGIQAIRSIDPSLLDIVAPNQSMSRNLNLTFGAAGFTFAEPGLYDVQAVVSLFNQNRNLIVPSNVVRVRIGTPHSIDDENDALVMLREDVGTYLALGGSRILDKARADLDGILERRMKVKGMDGVCANILRCKGIDAGRNYLLDRKPDSGDRYEAAKLLEKLSKKVLRRFFDRQTVRDTGKLAKKHRTAATA